MVSYEEIFGHNIIFIIDSIKISGLIEYFRDICHLP
ncbi:hypothetical protein ABIB40_000428 [Pedobacter sp. UYP30]